jgi:hypothetical protein
LAAALIRNPGAARRAADRARIRGGGVPVSCPLEAPPLGPPTHEPVGSNL